MAVVKNMIVRVGADLSGLIGGFKKGGKSMDSFKSQASAALRSATLTQQNLTKAMAQGGKNTAIVNLVDQIRELEAEQKELQKLGFGWGYEGYEGNAALLRSLKAELDEYVRAQERAEDATEETAHEAGKMGARMKAAGSWVKQAASQLLGIGKSAKASGPGVEGLLRSIRRLGVVSLSLRFMRSIFGELGTIVRQYISENETLQAQVNGLKSAMGQALAPAINIVTNAMAALMPYVVGVSNAIGQLISALGGGWATVAAEANGAAKAIKGAGGAQKDLNRSLQGFDEITKLSSKSGGGGGGGSSAGSAVKIEPITPQWLQEFVDELKAKIQAQDWPGVGNVVIEGLSFGIGAGAGAIGKFVKDKLWTPIKNYFKKHIEDAREEYPEIGNDIGLGIINGIVEAIGNGIDWLYEHVWLPIKDGWNAVFGGKKIGDVEVGVKDDTNKWWRSLKDKWAADSRQVEYEAVLKNNTAEQIKANADRWNAAKSSVEFQANVKNTAKQQWQSVVDQWEKEKDTVEFRADVANDGPKWRQSVADNWKNGVLALDPFHVDIADDSTTWWGNVKTWWNKTAGKLTTKFEVKVPTINVTWGKEVGPGGTVHIPQYNVQWNAKGLILNGAQLFGMVGKTFLGGGEAGREALLPLDRNDGWKDEIADRVALRVNGGGAEGQDITVNLLLDGKIVTSTVVRNINAQARATGRNPLAAYM